MSWNEQFLFIPEATGWHYSDQRPNSISPHLVVSWVCLYLEDSWNSPRTKLWTLHQEFYRPPPRQALNSSSLEEEEIEGNLEKKQNNLCRSWGVNKELSKDFENITSSDNEYLISLSSNSELLVSSLKGNEDSLSALNLPFRQPYSSTRRQGILWLWVFGWKRIKRASMWGLRECVMTVFLSVFPAKTWNSIHSI